MKHIPVIAYHTPGLISIPSLSRSSVTSVAWVLYTPTPTPPKHQYSSYAYLGHTSWHTGKSIQLQDLLSLKFKLSPRLAHTTERFMSSTAMDILQAGKNTSGDTALQWGFLRHTTAVLAATTHSMARETCGRSANPTVSWNGYCGCGLERQEAVAFPKISRFWISQYLNKVLPFPQSPSSPH